MDAARNFDSTGKGNFDSALASSPKIDCAIYDITQTESITGLGPLNCLILQDDIARMNTT